MSPPIRDGSGDSIGSIRLGDGSEIAEVRTGAGDVLFSASAIPDNLVDSFEDSDISDYSGDTGAYSVISSDSTDGNNALKLSNPTTGGRGSRDAIGSTSGLNDYPQRGDIFRCDWKPTQDIVGSGNRVTVVFAAQGESGTSNCYTVSISPGNDNFGIGDESLSGTANLKSESLGSLSTGTQYFVEVEWGSSTNNNTITARLVEKGSGNNVNEVSVQDSTYDSGGIGFGVNQGSGEPRCVYDYYRIQDKNSV